MSSFGDKAKAVIASVAPTLGTVLGGPLGGLAGAFLSKALGSDDLKQQEQMIAAADPQTLLALKQADNELQEHLKQLEVDTEKLRFDDIANARNREIQVRDNTPRIQSYMTTFGFFASLIGCFLIPIPDSSKAIVFSMIGSLGTVWITQQGYYFGSSSGSAAKTDAINSIISTKSKG